MATMRIKANLREELKDVLMEIEEYFPGKDAQELLAEALDRIVLRDAIFTVLEHVTQSEDEQAKDAA
jgi:hypothetical protein